MGKENEPKVTSINTLKGYMKGTLIKLPSFGPGQEFYARLKRPSMLDMIKNGEIPNALLDTANDLFAEGTQILADGDSNTTKDLFDVMDKLCEATFVEPSYSDIKEAGIKLTDEQMMFVFSYTQNGVKALDSFREESKNPELTTDEPTIPFPTK